MTDTQPRDGDSTGDDEPLSSLKAGRTRCSKETSSGFMSEISEEKTCKEPPCAADAEEQRSDSEDDQPLITMTNKNKKKQKPARAEPAAPESKKTRSPRKRKAGTTAPPIRKTSLSQVKVTQKRGTKGQQDFKKKPSAHPPSEKRRGRSLRKTNRAPSADSSDDDEPLIQIVRKKKQLQMKSAVVLLERMSQRDVDSAIAHRRPNNPERDTAAAAGSDVGEENSDTEPLSRKVKRLKEQNKPKRRAKPAPDSSSDDEPLGKKVKRLKTKDKRRKAANGNKDADNQGKEQSDSDERQVKKKSE